MRNPQFIAEHRGGSLTKEQHRQLMLWACLCAEHVLPLLGDDLDVRLEQALWKAHEWQNGNVSTGAAMKASVMAHQVARESSSPVSIAVARAFGHAVATAHMADHSLGAALYALKVVSLSGKPVEEEREWQNKQLEVWSPKLKLLVQTTMQQKGKSFNLT
jgi:hypothetical protein